MDSDSRGEANRKNPSKGVLIYLPGNLSLSLDNNSGLSFIISPVFQAMMVGRDVNHVFPVLEETLDLKGRLIAQDGILSG